MTTKTYDRQTAKLIARVAENIPEMDGNVMQGWIDNPRALQKFLAGLILPQGTQEASGSNSLVVNCGLSLPEMIAPGHYDWVNLDITAEHFPITETGVKGIVVATLGFGRDISSQEDGVKELQKRGMNRPATLAELLAYGARHPEEQRKHPIVALGSIVEMYGTRGVPCLYGSRYLRGLDIVWDNPLGVHYRFLAVCN
jgi:hypothetical protein